MGGNALSVNQTIRLSNADFQQALALEENFNDVLVSEWTGLTDKQLEQFMQHLRKMQDIFGKEAWTSFVLCAGREGIKNWVMPYYHAFMEHQSAFDDGPSSGC